MTHKYSIGQELIVSSHKDNCRHYFEIGTRVKVRNIQTGYGQERYEVETISKKATDGSLRQTMEGEDLELADARFYFGQRVFIKQDLPGIKKGGELIIEAPVGPHGDRYILSYPRDRDIKFEIDAQYLSFSPVLPGVEYGADMVGLPIEEAEYINPTQESIKPLKWYVVSEDGGHNFSKGDIVFCKKTYSGGFDHYESRGGNVQCVHVSHVIDALEAGDEVVVTKQYTGHEFKIGELVVILAIEEDKNRIKAQNKEGDYWWLNHDEYRPTCNQPTIALARMSRGGTGGVLDKEALISIIETYKKANAVLESKLKKQELVLPDAEQIYVFAQLYAEKSKMKQKEVISIANWICENIVELNKINS